MMRPNGLAQQHQFLRTLGSLWFAAVLLSLLLLAMACATVFERSNGTERTLALFYHAWWFNGLLGLLAANILATLIVRYPFSRRQVGFVVTHVSILLIYAGALLTAYYGVDGRLGIVEGQSESMVSVDGITLTVLNTQSGHRGSLDLKRAIGSGLEERSMSASSLELGDVLIHVDRYLPDTVVRETVTNDAPRSQPAVQIRLGQEQESEAVWLFAGKPDDLGPVKAAYRVLDTEDQLAALTKPAETEQSESIGTVRITVDGALYAVPVEQCTAEPANVGNTGMTAKVLRYLPHATVSEGGKLINSSPRPMNPAIEVEISKDGVSETRLAFARFPDFGSMHSKQQLMDVKVTFDFSGSVAANAPLELFSLPSGKMYIRFAQDHAEPVLHEVRLGEAIETPWSNKRLTVLRAFDRARHGHEVVAAEAVRKRRIPAVHVSISSDDNPAREMWVRQGFSTRLMAGGAPLQLIFGDRLIPLDFEVKLDKFRVGYYPGTQRPRSFESHVSITDAATGLTQSRVISMNHPVKFGGYTFYQSSYDIQTTRTVSYLSVARDPGQLVVFAGYIGTIVGMLLVLALRVKDQRNYQADSSESAHDVARPRNNSKDIPLLVDVSACVNDAGLLQNPGGTPRPVPLSPNLGRKGGRKQCK